MSGISTVGTIQKRTVVTAGEFAGLPAIEDADPQDLVDQLLDAGDVNLLDDAEYTYFLALFSLTPSNDDILQKKAGAWTNRTIAQYKADLALNLVNNTSDADKPISTAQAVVNALKAPLLSPTFTGTPTAPTAIAGTNTTQIATTAFVMSNGFGVGDMLKSQNLSGLANYTTARSNLGLGTLATQSGTFSSKQDVITSGDVTVSAGVTTIGAGVVTEAMQVLADNTTNNSSTSNHGYLKKLSNVATEFMNGQGAWAVPSLTGILATAITNGDTTHAPDGNTIYDAMVLKADLISPSFTTPSLGVATADSISFSDVITTLTNLGLENVENTSDADKPISDLTQDALDLKAPLASPLLTGYPSIGEVNSTSFAPFEVYGALDFSTVFYDNQVYGIDKGGAVAFGGEYTSGGAYALFGAIKGLKENGTDGDNAGYLVFRTKTNGGGLTTRFSISSTGVAAFTNTLSASNLSGTNTGDNAANTNSGLVHTTGAESVAGAKTFSDIIAFADGAAATPSMAHAGDLNTGVFFPSADTIALATAGVERMRITSAGLLGIGITPIYHFQSAVPEDIAGLKTYSAQSEGLGVHYSRNTSDDYRSFIDFISNRSSSGTAGGGGFRWFYQPRSAGFPTLGMTLSDVGAVTVGGKFQAAEIGIGISPAGTALLELNGTTNIRWVMASSVFQQVNTGEDFTMGTRALDIMTLKGGGNVGVGTGAPAVKLDVEGVIKAKGYTVAGLPTGVVGGRAYVTNALTPVFGSTVVGGGAVTVPVFYDGTNWIVG